MADGSQWAVRRVDREASASRDAEVAAVLELLEGMVQSGALPQGTFDGVHAALTSEDTSARDAMLRQLEVFTASALAAAPTPAAVPADQSMGRLPRATLLRVLTYLSPKDITTFACVDRRTRRVANDEVVWRTVVEAAVPAVASFISAEGAVSSYRSLYTSFSGNHATLERGCRLLAVTRRFKLPLTAPDFLVAKVNVYLGPKRLVGATGCQTVPLNLRGMYVTPDRKHVVLDFMPRGRCLYFAGERTSNGVPLQSYVEVELVNALRRANGDELSHVIAEFPHMYPTRGPSVARRSEALAEDPSALYTWREPTSKCRMRATIPSVRTARHVGKLLHGDEEHFLTAVTSTSATSHSQAHKANQGIYSHKPSTTSGSHRCGASYEVQGIRVTFSISELFSLAFCVEADGNGDAGDGDAEDAGGAAGAGGAGGAGMAPFPAPPPPPGPPPAEGDPFP